MFTTGIYQVNIKAMYFITLTCLEDIKSLIIPTKAQMAIIAYPVRAFATNRQGSDPPMIINASTVAVCKTREITAPSIRNEPFAMRQSFLFLSKRPPAFIRYIKQNSTSPIIISILTAVEN
jgi:hypothetical protein